MWCGVCQQNASIPTAKQVSWNVPEQGWGRIHFEHADPVEGHMLLITEGAKQNGYRFRHFLVLFRVQP